MFDPVEREELDEILLNFAKRVEKIPRGKTYGWDEEKAALLQWRTKSLLALLPEEPKSILPEGEESHYTYNDGKRDTLQDIKNKLNKEVS